MDKHLAKVIKVDARDCSIVIGTEVVRDEVNG